MIVVWVCHAAVVFDPARQRSSPISGRLSRACGRRGGADVAWTSGRTSEKVVRWSPFLTCALTSAEACSPSSSQSPRGRSRAGARQWIDAGGSRDGAKAASRIADAAATRFGQQKPDGDRTWWAEIDDGEVVGVGVLESADGRVECVTTVRGSENVAWQWHQERYTKHDGRLALIEVGGGGNGRRRPDDAQSTARTCRSCTLPTASSTDLRDGAIGQASYDVYRRSERALGPEEFGAELTRAVVGASLRLGLSRRNDVAIAYLAYFQYRTFPPDLLVITRDELDEILADDDPRHPRHRARRMGSL